MNNENIAPYDAEDGELVIEDWIDGFRRWIDGFRRGFRRGRSVERAAIAAWLRLFHGPNGGSEFADFIERGEHLRGDDE